jgi:Peptidase A4 family
MSLRRRETAKYGLTAFRVSMAAFLVAALSASLVTAAAANTVTARPASPSGRVVPGVVFTTVKGCGEPVTLATPARAGAALPGRALGLPDGPGSVLAAAARRHSRFLKTLKCAAHRTEPTKARRRRASGSLNWAGWVDNTPSPNYVQATWQAASPCCDEHSFDSSSIWPGIGSGTGGTELIQDGTEADMSASGQRTLFLWFEVYPAEFQQQIKNMKVRLGDKISVSASYNASAAPGATFVICNVTRNVCLAANQRSKRPDGHAEWIVERTSFCDGRTLTYPPLASIGPVKFSGARYDINGDGNPVFAISHGHHGRSRMFDNEGDQLAQAGALSSHGTAFLVVQNAVGHADHGTCHAPG